MTIRRPYKPGRVKSVNGAAKPKPEEKEQSKTLLQKFLSWRSKQKWCANIKRRF